MNRLFVNGESYSKIVETEQGWIGFIADVSIQGGELVLGNISIEPMHTKLIQIGAKASLQMRRQVLEEARREGYTTIVMEGVRLKTGKPKRPFLRRRVIS